MFIARRAMMSTGGSGLIVNLSATYVAGGTNYNGDYNLTEAPITLSKNGSYLLIPQKSFKIYVMGSAGGGPGDESDTLYEGGGGGGGGEHVLATLGSGFELQLEAGEEYTLRVGTQGFATYIQDSLSTNLFYLNPGQTANQRDGGPGGSGGDGTPGGTGGAGGARRGAGGAGTLNSGTGGGGYGDDSPYEVGQPGGSPGGGAPGQDGAPSNGLRTATGVPFIATGGTTGGAAVTYGGGGGGGTLDFFRPGTIRLDGTHSLAGGGGGGSGSLGNSGVGGQGILVLDAVA